MPHVSEWLIKRVKGFEGLHDGDKRKPNLQPALCPANKVTMGWGHVLLDAQGRQLEGAEGLKAARGVEWTLEKADKQLVSDLSERLQRIAGWYPWLPQHRIEALVSFAYNTGEGPIRPGANTGIARALAKRDGAAVAREMPRWNKMRPHAGAPLEVSAGLVARRKAEVEWWLGGESADSLATPVLDMPQAVEPPADNAKLGAGEKGAIGLIGTGALTAVIEHAGQARDLLASVGVPAQTIGLLLAAAVVGFGVWWYLRARRVRLSS